MNLVPAFTVSRVGMIEEVNRFLDSCANSIISHQLRTTADAIYSPRTLTDNPHVTITIYIHRNGNRVVGHVFSLTADPSVGKKDVELIGHMDKIMNSVIGLLKMGLSERARMPNGEANHADSLEVKPASELPAQKRPSGLQQASHVQRDEAMNIANLHMILVKARANFRESAKVLCAVLQQLNSGRSEAFVTLDAHETDVAKIGVLRALHRRGFNVEVDSQVLYSEGPGVAEINGLCTSLIVTRAQRIAAVEPYAINWAIADDIPAPPYDHRTLGRLKAALAEYGNYLNDPELSDGVLDNAAL